MKKSKRFLSLLLSIIMILSILPVSSLAADSVGLDNFKKVNSYANENFTDVNSDDWFYDNVKSAFEYGLMIGKDNNLFDTEGNVTIAETMTIAARLHSIYYIGKADFAQSDPWYQVYADYCKANIIANSANYDITAPATRAQFALILANAMPDEAWESINKVADNAIPDVKMTDGFSTAVYKLYRAGILVGNDEKGTFAPESNIKRCEVAALVTRMADVSLRKSIKLGNEYTVSLNLNYNGKSLEPVTVFEGEKVAVPAIPERIGYTFRGWYTLANGGNRFDFDTEITSDVTLYAQWNVIWIPFPPIPTQDTYYTVTFDSNGGSAVASQQVKAGECAVEPSVPTREGYVFGGWYVDSASQADYDFSEPCMTNITLTAQWTTVFSENSYIYDNSDSHIKTDEETMISYYDNILLAFLLGEPNEAEKQEIADIVDGEIVGQLCDITQILEIRVRNSSMNELKEMAQKLEKDSRVSFATFDKIMPDIDVASVSYTDTDPWVLSNEWDADPDGGNWAFEAIDVYQAWHDYGSLLKPVTVGILDNGFNVNHEDLKDKIEFISVYGNNKEEENHGTSVAGIIGAEKNSVGMCGIAYTADLICSDFTDLKDTVEFTYIFTEMLLKDKGAIINLSLGYKLETWLGHWIDQPFTENDHSKDDLSQHAEYDQQFYSEYLGYMISRGYDPLFVQGAGNGIDNTYIKPFDAYLNGLFSSCTNESNKSAEAKYGLPQGTIKDHIIITTSVENIKTDTGYQLVSGANRGETVDICAPGKNVYATDKNGGYRTNFGGTSAAAPIVTGVAALLKSLDPSLKAATIKSILINSATRKGSGTDKEFGYCEYPLVNARSAVEYLITSIKKGAVIGHVVESDTGEAISNAKVTLINTELNQKCTFQTDSKGYIADFIGTLMRGYTKAKIEAEGYELLEIDIEESNGTYDIGTIRMVRSTPTTFTLTHGTDSIVPGSHVELYNGNGTQIWNVTSNKPWTVTSPAWCKPSVSSGAAGTTIVEFKVTGSTDSNRSGTVKFTTEDGQTYSVTVSQKASHLKGWIVAGLNQPINGAVVTVSNGEKSWNYTTGANGVFDIAVPNAWYTISVAAAGYESTSYDQDVLVNGEDVDIGEILLAKSIMNSLTGTIKDGDVNSPTYGQVLEGVSLEVYDSTGKKVGDTAKSNANGVVAFAFPAAGTYKFVFSLVGYETVTVDTVIINENTPSLGTYVMMRAESNTSISGTTTPGTKLELLDEDGNVLAETVADENGKYEFKDIPGWDGTIFRIRIKDTTITVDAVGGATGVAVDATETIFTVSTPDTVRIGNEIGATSEWEIESSHEWFVTATGDTSWYTLSSTTGKCGITEFTVTANSVTDVYRESVLTFALNNRTFEVTIYQDDISSIIASGYCGGDLSYAYDSASDAYKNLTWKLYDDGKLVISGKGKMRDYYFTHTADYVYYTTAPWGKYIKQIKSLELTSGLTTIGYSAFEGCDQIASNLVIPDTVFKIEERAFMNCSGIAGSLAISKGVTSIGKAAFYGCSGFTGSLVIPDGVTNIEDSAFQFCSGFTGSLVLPTDVMSIGYNAFASCSGFTGSLVIPDSVTSIGEQAFRDCSGFTGSLVIPDSVTSIGERAFYNCGEITNIIIDSIYYKSQNGILYSGDMTTLICCPAGKSGKLTIPDSVTSIGDSAFCYCSGFTGSLVIPDSVTSIGDSAFYGCSGFTGIYFKGNAPSVSAATSSNHDSFPTDLTLYYIDGTTGWTDSEYYDAAAGTWNGYKLEKWEGTKNLS